MSTHQLLRTLGEILAIGVLTQISMSPVYAAGKKPITKGQTKIVRAVNQQPQGNSCLPDVIGTGNDPAVGPSTDLTNLSVSCSDDPAVTYGQLKAPLAGANRVYCVTTLSKLRKQRSAVTVVADPTVQNSYHCLLATITPKEFVAATKEQK